MKKTTTLLVMAIFASISCNALNYFWVGGSGSWSDFNNHWATTSGGNIFHSQVPQSTDNVYFDALSFTSATPTVTIDQTIVQCADMDWTGVFNTPTLLGASSDTLRIYGSLTLSVGINFNFNGQVSMEATTAKTIASGGSTINGSLAFNGIGGSWNLSGVLSVTKVIYLNNGTLYTYNQTVNAAAFYSSTTSNRAINMGSSTFNLLNYNGDLWTVNPVGMTLNAGTSTINGTCIGTGGSFTGGGFTYNDLFFTGIAVGNIYDNNTFHDVSFASDGVIYGSNTFHDVSFAGNATIYGNPMFGPNTFNNVTIAKNGTFWSGNIFNNLSFSPGYAYTLQAGQTQTVGNICAQGTGALPIRIQSSTVGVPAIISKTSGTICWDYVHVSDITGTGGATFNAGLVPTLSQNLGGNTGLLFTGGCTAVSCFPCTAPSITTNPISKSVCAGTIANFFVIASGVNLTYQWQVNQGAGFINLSGIGSNLLGVQFVSMVMNGFQYRCVVSSGTCTSTSNAATLTVNPAPIVTVNSATICSGQTATLTASGATSYFWPSGALPPAPPVPPLPPPPITGLTTNPIFVSPLITTTYTVKGTTNGCSNTAIATVTVNPVPIVTALVSSTTVTVSATGGTPPYTGTGTFTGVAPGTYSYTVTDVNGCAGNTSATVVADERSSSESSGPGVEWQNISWADEDIYDNFQPQINSGEDWWYSHKNAYSGSTQTGYITVGYSSLILRSEADFNQAKSVFNEGSGSPYNPINHDQKSNNLGTYMNYDFTGNSTFNTQEGCHDRDRINEYRTPTRGQVALNDINGNMLWCKSLCVGTLEEVIQDGNFFYVVGIHVGIRGYNDHTAFLAYNPTSPTPNTFNGVSVSPINKVRHLYIAKIDMNGTILWQALYGMPDYVTSPLDALKTHSYGYDIIKSSSGKLIACGYGEEGTGMHHQPFVIELDPTTGYIFNKKLLPISSVTSVKGYSTIKGEARSLVELDNTGNYAVGCTYSFANEDPDDLNEALVWCLGSNLLPSTSWSTNPIRLPGTGGITGKKNSNIWEVKYHQAKQELLVPVVSACNFCTYAGNNDGKGIIYRYKNNGTLSTTGTNPSAIGPINAYDLRIGVEETSDGGFVSVSSRQTATGIPATVTPPTSAELGYLSTCYLHEDIAADYPYWDTDPLITKFDLNGNKVWEKIFDIAPNRPREQPLGDLKQQECMYKISQTQDGGYTISGNSSHNYDDNYLVKLFSDCNLTQNYTINEPADLTITSNTAIWNSSQKVIGSVHVKSGAILTITGSSTVIEFADSKLTGIQTNIFVELGGKLIVKNGATLTSILASTCPGSMWDGIIIGGSSLKQIAGNQGWVTLSSNCKIENARKGVYLSRVTGNPIASGGILQASNATFRNNYIDVEFTPYIAPLNNLGNEPNNLSYFKSCNFIGDAVLNDPSYTLIFGGRLTTDKHVILREVKGIRFTGNNFKTDLTSLGSNYSTLSRSYGIYSINASFNVHPDCSIINTTTGECAGTKNNFENLYHGIYAQSSNPLKSFTVNLTNFTNCYASLYQGGINYSKVTKNNFIINTTIPAPQYPLCLGGTCPNYFNYANQCSGFTYQENTFTVTGNQQVIGSLFNASGTGNNLSYRNTYTGLKLGTQTQQINGVNSTSTGLQIKCNQNAGVSASDITSTSGVIPKQGFCGTLQSPANNIFSHNGISEGDIKVASSANSFIYSHSVNPPAGLQVPLNYTTTKVATIGCGGGSFDYTTSCPSKLVTGNSVNFQKSLVISYGQLADIAKQVLTNGNESSLYIAISSAMSAGNLKNALTNPGPYLSDGVLIAYLQRTATPPPGHIKDVVITNSPVTQPVKNVIDNLNLPNGIRNQINAAQIGTSTRAQQETVVQSYEAQKQLAINDGISLLMTDTTIANVYAEMESFLILDNTLKGKTDLTNLYISNVDYLKAQHLIDSLISLPELVKYATMLQHYNELQQQNKTWEELQNDAQLSNDITTLASDSLAAGFANARSVLAMVNGAQNYDLIEDFVENGNLRSTSIQNSADSVISTINNDLKLNVYPNPFKDEINVRINYPINPANSRLQLMELATGKIIAEQIVGFKQSFVFNTAQLANGVYLVVLKGENVSPSYVKVIHLK